MCFDRSKPDSAAHFGWALRAAATAASMSFGRALRDARDAFAARGIEDVEQVAGFGEVAVDEMAEAAFVLFEPDADVLAAFRGGP